MENKTTDEKGDRVRKELKDELEAEGKSPEEVEEILKSFGV